MTKFLHTADWHIRDADIDEIEKCLDFLIHTAKKEKPDVIIHAGDFYDSQDIKTDSKSTKLLFRVVSDLANIAPFIGIIGTPSHDGTAAEVLDHIKAEYPVHIAMRPEQIYLYEDGQIEKGIYNKFSPLASIISLIPAPTKQFFKSNSDIKGADSEIAQAMSGLFAGFGAKWQECFDKGYDIDHILVGHFQIGGAMVSETQVITGIDIEISKDQLLLANADLICLGHLHLKQNIDPNIFYSGSLYRKDFGELEDKGFYIHEIDGEIDSSFIQTPTRKLAKLEYDMTIEGAMDELDAVMYAFDKEEIKDSDLRVTFKVYQDEAGALDKVKISDFYLAAGANDVQINLMRIPRENVRSKTLLKLKTLREKIVENASLKDETVQESILLKADMLEAMSQDDIISDIMKGGDVIEAIETAP